jgi:hypothetical protein
MSASFMPAVDRVVCDRAKEELSNSEGDEKRFICVIFFVSDESGRNVGDKKRTCTENKFVLN